MLNESDTNDGLVDREPDDDHAGRLARAPCAGIFAPAGSPDIPLDPVGEILEPRAAFVRRQRSRPDGDQRQTFIGQGEHPVTSYGPAAPSNRRPERQGSTASRRCGPAAGEPVDAIFDWPGTVMRFRPRLEASDGCTAALASTGR